MLSAAVGALALATDAQAPMGEGHYTVLPAHKSDCVRVCGVDCTLQDVWHSCQRRRHSSAHATAPDGLSEPQWG